MYVVGQAICNLILQVDNKLAIPHVSVPSIAWVDWDALRKAGFEGCVLDKDNTLTHPYRSQIAPQLLPSLDRCQRAFAGRLVLFSNSAGLHQFDPEGNSLSKRKDDHKCHAIPAGRRNL